MACYECRGHRGAEDTEFFSVFLCDLCVKYPVIFKGSVFLTLNAALTRKKKEKEKETPIK